MKKIGSRTILVERRIRQDKFDDASTGAYATHAVKGCMVMPRLASGTQGNENDKGWTIAEGHTVYAPFDADVVSDDIIRLTPGGERWEVDGDPGWYENKRGVGKAIQFYLKRLGT